MQENHPSRGGTKQSRVKKRVPVEETPVGESGERTRGFKKRAHAVTGVSRVSRVLAILGIKRRGVLSRRFTPDIRPEHEEVSQGGRF